MAGLPPASKRIMTRPSSTIDRHVKASVSGAGAVRQAPQQHRGATDVAGILGPAASLAPRCGVDNINWP